MAHGQPAKAPYVVARFHNLVIFKGYLFFTGSYDLVIDPVCELYSLREIQNIPDILSYLDGSRVSQD